MSETRFYRDAAGRYVGAFVGAAPPAGSIGVPAPPVDARQTWADGAWQPLPPPPYRDLRAAAYAQELGKDAGDQIKAIGDALDVVIAELRARGFAETAEFAAMAAKIDAIKARYPKT